MSDAPEMSPVTKELFTKLRMMVPPMLDKFHKGRWTITAHVKDIVLR